VVGQGHSVIDAIITADYAIMTASRLVCTIKCKIKGDCSEKFSEQSPFILHFIVHTKRLAVIIAKNTHVCFLARVFKHQVI